MAEEVGSKKVGIAKVDVEDGNRRLAAKYGVKGTSSDAVYGTSSKEFSVFSHIVDRLNIYILYTIFRVSNFASD